MGTWGAKLFSSDFACDIKNEYISIIGCGINEEKALSSMKEYFEINEVDYAEYSEFWCVIAALQIKYCRLTNEVKRKALECINIEVDLINQNKEDSEYFRKRKKVLEKVKYDIINYQISEPKKPKLKIHKALGNPGDVLVYHLINYSIESENKFIEKICKVKNWDAELFKVQSTPWFIGKYLLLYISRIEREPISNVMPELQSNEYTYCMMYDWIGNEMPDISVTPNIKLTDYSVIHQEKGGVRRSCEMMLEPKSKLKLNKKQYLINIGKSINTTELPYDNSAQVVFDMESELDSLFKENKDIESHFESLLDNI